MKNINPYLIFNGNCRQAMDFYQECLGGVLYMMPYSAAPGLPPLPKEVGDWIIHARLTIKTLILMASDTQPNLPTKMGDNLFVSLDCESVEEINTIFAALSVNATIKMPLQETFYAIRFGMLTDQFGVNWMLNLEKPKEK